MSIQIKDKAPKLRFPEFGGSWERKKLSEVAKLCYGMNAAASKFDAFNHYIRITDIEEDSRSLQTTKPVSPAGKLSGDYRVNMGDILLARTGASTGKSYYHSTKGSYYFAGFLIRARIFTQNDSFFIYSQTLTDRYKRWVAVVSMRSGQPGINAEEYGTYPLDLPPLPEQKKIADFLTLVDRKIELQRRKVELLKDVKRGLLQQMFEKYARLDDEAVKLDSLLLERTERGMGGEELLSVTMHQGVMARSEIDAKDNSSGDKSNYKVVYKGDIVYNSMRMWQGASGVSSYQGIVSPAYTVVYPMEGFSAEWLGYLFKTKKMIETFRRFSQGLTSDTWNLKYPQLKEISIRIPALDEQNYSVSCMKALDASGLKNQKKLTSLHLFKKGLLQQMFV